MTSAAVSSTPYTSDPQVRDGWGSLRDLINSAARQKQKERAFPRLAIQVKLWVKKSLVPRHPDPEKQLRQMLRRALIKHEILLCDEEPSIGLLDDRLPQLEPVDIIIQWAVPIPVKDLAALSERARKLGDCVNAFAALADKELKTDKGRSS